MKLPIGWRIEQDRPCGWFSVYNEKGELMAAADEITQNGVNKAWFSEKMRRDMAAKDQLLD